MVGNARLYWSFFFLSVRDVARRSNGDGAPHGRGVCGGFHSAHSIVNWCEILYYLGLLEPMLDDTLWSPNIVHTVRFTV
jgi:hypothetical protein